MSDYVSPDEPTNAAWRCPTYGLQGLSRVNGTDTNKVTFHLRSGTTLTGCADATEGLADHAVVRAVGWLQGDSMATDRLV